jgi:FeS assembly SUF system regulator
MLRIGKLTDYAIMVMVELSGCRGQVISAQALAEKCGLELPTVSKLLKLLTRAELVRSFRGANGGYRVDRAAAEISVAEVIAAIEGPIAMTECSIDTGLCQQEENCNLRSNWQRISVAVAEAMQRVTLAEMASPVPARANALRIATLNA